MSCPLTHVRGFLDELLQPALSDDPEGNGLLVAGTPDVGRIGAAVNTSFAVIEAAAANAVDLLLVHHAPWSAIDLHLRERKLLHLSQAGISLYAAHDSLDRADRASTLDAAGALARLLEIELLDPRDQSLIIGTASAEFEPWLSRISSALDAPVRAWRNNPRFERVAIVPGGGGSTRYLAAALAKGCDTFVTGEGSLYTELFAREVGLTLVYATHVATELPGIRALAAKTAEVFRLPWIVLPEAAGISGGGRAPLCVGC